MMNDLLTQLDQWLRTHRADFYPKLNPPATEEQLKELEVQAGVPLPAEFKTLLLWKNGQQEDALDAFHPLTNEMFASSQSMIQTMRENNELVRFGDISAGSWSHTWAPFMDNGGGNYSCVDLRTAEVLSRDHETQEIAVTFSSLQEWLAALLEELLTNNFASWDFKECRKG